MRQKKPHQKVVDDKKDKDVKDRIDAEMNTCEEENKTADEQIHRYSASRETKATQTPRVVGDNKHNDVELYSCEYENKTDDEQIHRFSTSRETAATTRIELQENYTLGADTNIEVNIGCVKMGGKVNGGLSVTKINGQEYSKSLTWSIDTEIKVPAKQRAIAKLHVNEYRVVTDFTVKTTVTLPKKKMPVSIRRISDNKLIYTVWIQNIDAIFDLKFLKRAEDVIEVIDIPNEAEKKTYIGLILKSRGTCNNVSFRNQNVTVECKPFSDENQLQKEETKCPISYEDRDKYVTQDSFVNDHTADAEHDATVPKSVDDVLPGVADDSSATVPNGRLHQDDGIPKIMNGAVPHATEKTSEIVRNGNVLTGAADDSSATVPNGRLHQDDGISKLVNGVVPHATDKNR